MVSLSGQVYMMQCLFRRGAPTPWEACMALLPQEPGKVTVAAIPPGSYVARRLAEREPAEAVFLHTPREALTAGSEVAPNIPIVLGDRDRDHTSAIRSWPAVPQIRSFRIRRLDTLYATSHCVGLIVLDCAVSASSILRGAERVLRDHRPSVILDLSGIPVAARLEAWESYVQSLGPNYDWFDGLLLPCFDAERRMEAVLCLAGQTACAIPSEQRGTYANLPFGGEPPTSLIPAADLARSGWQSVLPSDDSRFGSITVQFDDTLVGRNFYPAETDTNGAWWRWTGPYARSIFTMPIAGAGRWTASFDIINPGNVASAEDIAIYAGSSRLAALSFGPSHMRFGPFSIGIMAALSGIDIQIVTGPTRRTLQAGSRQVGISLSRCILDPA